MKLAIFADIHSNADAFAAAVADARKQGADAFAVAGDIVSDGPSARECVELVRALTPHVIKGNREDYMLRHRAGLSPGWEGSAQFSSLLWTYCALTPEDLDWMAALPEQTVVPLEGGMALRLVHGSPFSMYELLKPHDDIAPVERAAEATPEQALAFGHNHEQWTGTVRGRLLVNPGSAGVHFNEQCAAEYGIVTYKRGWLSAELRRVPYDFAALERRLETSGLMAFSPAWTKVTFEGVKVGRNYIPEFFADARQIMAEHNIPSGPIPNEIWEETAEDWWRKMGWGKYPR